MATKVGSASSQHLKKDNLSLFASTDHEILNQIYATHVHDDEKFDVESLFIIVENILKRATQIVDNVVLIQCKAPSEEVAYGTTMSILNKLSNYAWDAKAVLNLAAFALDYGESWLLAQNQSSHQLAKSVATLRRVSILLKGPNLQKHCQALIELNTLIKTTLVVIECAHL